MAGVEIIARFRRRIPRFTWLRKCVTPIRTIEIPFRTLFLREYGGEAYGLELGRKASGGST